MLDFSNFDNTSGSFPDVEATDASGPTLRDGTPLNANFVNDVWGSFQAILNAAGVTPSDSVETSSASDLLDSIRKLGGAPGEVTFYASPGETIAANILPLKGQVISISAYPALVAATYIGDGNNADPYYTAFYKCSDSGGTTRNVAGPYFKLPDCRGHFPRALAGAATGRDAGRDYDQTTYGSDFRNMSGKNYLDTPGWHIHAVEVDDTNELIGETYYMMKSNPGNITGSSATVPTFPIILFKSSGSGTTELQTRKGKLAGSIDYSSVAGYNEVRPLSTGFQLGIRY